MIALWLACAGEPSVAPVVAPEVEEVDEPGPLSIVEVDAQEPEPQPNIVITAPAERYAVTPGTLSASGTAIAWEGRLTVQLKAGDELLDEQHVTASAAAPARGDWTVELTVPAGQSGGPWTIQAFTRSARDGSIQDAATVDLSGP